MQTLKAHLTSTVITLGTKARDEHSDQNHFAQKITAPAFGDPRSASQIRKFASRNLDYLAIQNRSINTAK
jgi:hypothetical protein